MTRMIDRVMRKRVLVLAAGTMGLLLAGHPAAASRAMIPLWDAAAIGNMCARSLADARASAGAIGGAEPGKSSSPRVFRAWDRLRILLEDTEGPVELLANVSPDKATRSAAEDCMLKFTEFNTDLLQDRRIYARIQRAAPADDIDRKLRKDVMDAFEDSGVALPDAKRARLKEILQRLEEVRQIFNRNIRDNKTRIEFSPDEMKGLPAPYLDKALRNDKGNYLLGFEYPEYEPFMANAENEDARRRFYIAFNVRGTPQNLELLAEATRLRREIAGLFGLPSYARYATRRRMVENPERVLRFLDEVKERVAQVERREIDELRAFKAGRLGKNLTEVNLNRWDLAYYQEQSRRQRFSVDQEALRAYFPTDASIEWALGISSELYGVGFVRVEVPVWHPMVRYYDVIDGKTGRLLSGIYLDLFPRDGKYSHAAAFGVRSSSSVGRRTPISVLVTNFNPKGLNHRELETMLHEFGHVLHGVLSQTRYASQGGTTVERDFVEAPSQIYEEWARKSEPLQLLRKYCPGCPEIDADLVRRLRASHNYGSGVLYARQHLYASYDMTLTGPREVDPMQTWIQMESDTPVGYVPGTEFPGTFAHMLGGYAAGYYGYMWSKVIALDMLSMYGKNIMNPAAGQRFRALVLSQGGQKRAARMVREFIGRAPSPEAFFDEITGQRDR
jgi:thimet oligopeptidase